MSNSVHRQTDRQTDKQTNHGKSKTLVGKSNKHFGTEYNITREAISHQSYL